MNNNNYLNEYLYNLFYTLIIAIIIIIGLYAIVPYNHYKLYFRTK